MRHDAVAADELVQRDLGHQQVVLRGDLLRVRQVGARLGFAGVGDGGVADLEVALGRCQLFGDRLAVALHRLQRVGRGQHVEVGLRHAHDQVLVGLRQLRLRDVLVLLRLVDLQVVLAVVDRLLRVDRGARLIGGGLLGGRHFVDLGRIVRVGDADDRGLRLRRASHLHLQVGRGQVCRARLLVAVVRRVRGGTRAQVGGVDAACRLHHFGQALRLCADGAESQDEGADERLEGRRHRGETCARNGHALILGETSRLALGQVCTALRAAMHARCDDLQPAHPLTTFSADRLRTGRDRSTDAAIPRAAFGRPSGSRCLRMELDQKWKRAGSGNPSRRVAFRSNRLRREKLPSALAV